jgi:hypothetical protein
MSVYDLCDAYEPVEAFFKLGMNIIPLEAVPPLYFLIVGHECRRRVGRTNSWGGSNTDVTEIRILKFVVMSFKKVKFGMKTEHKNTNVTPAILLFL